MFDIFHNGSVLYVWHAGEMYRGGPRKAFFHPEIGFERVEVSCPVGWSLKSHPDLGVVLSDLEHPVLTADQVYDLALKGEAFRVRG